MFNPLPHPRVFGLAPGVDFPAALVQGLEEQFPEAKPEALARVEIFVNTRRMQRRLREIFDAGPARLLPRIRLITDLAHDPIAASLGPAVSPLRRRLEISTLVAQLLEQQPDLAARASVYDLSDSLAALMDEMQGEGVEPSVIAGLDVTDQSGHWARALNFVQIVQRYFGETDEPLDQEARQRAVVARLIAHWDAQPPTHPIIVAGSTGSRGTTSAFMQAVARLPQGAVILPGFDFDLTAPTWDAIKDEDHPQFRFIDLMRSLSLEPDQVPAWAQASPPRPERNKLISLSLRPAPVTDQWLTEGKNFSNLATTMSDITLLEAETPRQEALAIALRLRAAAEDGKTAALITPDRMLTRQVTAALDQWAIRPDDSAGLPLQLSAPGRLLRHVGGLFGQPLTAEALLTLLKHPLTHSGSDRGPHLLWSRELELFIRRNGVPFPTAADLMEWAQLRDDDGRVQWAAWLGHTLPAADTSAALSLTDHIARHIAVTEALAAGPEAEGSGELWEEAAGLAARKICDDIRENSGFGGNMAPRDYAALFNAVLSGGEVRRSEIGHPNILIWGTLEARVQGASLVILGGMNDGTWPEAPAHDPWLNRALRSEAGLLLPERRIGLSAHDYQQAVGAREVWITRSSRSDDAESVPSRWVNRLVNLLGGLKSQGGETALKDMRARGKTWLGYAKSLDTPRFTTPPATRPSPRPPITARPRSLSVTRIKTLIRDPYAIYAEKVLRLRALDPLTASPDAPLRGVAMHKIFELFIRESVETNTLPPRSRLIEIAREVLEQEAPWATARTMWLAGLERVADWFLETETAHRGLGSPVLFEKLGSCGLSGIDFTLTAKADRMDRTSDGAILIYDYKTGTPPTKKQQELFDKQLLLEAAMVERGAFEKDIGTATVDAASFIGLGSKPSVVPAPLAEESPDKVWEEFHDLIRAWMGPTKGFTARRAVEKNGFGSDYDHLSRFGEWDITELPTGEDVS